MRFVQSPASAPSPEALERRFVTGSRQVMGADLYGYNVYDPDTGRLELLADVCWAEQRLPDLLARPAASGAYSRRVDVELATVDSRVALTRALLT